jgi:hypothetical protein
MQCQADSLQCVALVAELGISCRIEQLVQADDGPLQHEDIGAGAPKVFLLFRPGHYDLLFPK